MSAEVELMPPAFLWGEQETAPGLLEKAKETLSQRGQDYDSPGGERSMAHTVHIFNAIIGRPALSEREGWIFMMAIKQARMMQGAPKADTFVDLAAYASLTGECALRESGK